MFELFYKFFSYSKFFCSKFFLIIFSSGGFEGRIHAPVPWSVNHTTSWTLEVTFVGTKLMGFDCWNAKIENQKIDIKDISTEFKLVNLDWNGKLNGGALFQKKIFPIFEPKVLVNS